jgi:hypothetical protein
MEIIILSPSTGSRHISTVCNDSVICRWLWPIPLFMHHRLRLLQMPPRKRTTPSLGRGGRGGRASTTHPSPVMANQDGYDRTIPNSLRQLLDDWEEELTGSLPASQHTSRHRCSYWVVKNLLARSLLSLPGVFAQSPPNSPRSPHSPTAHPPPSAPPSPNAHPPPSTTHPNNSTPQEKTSKHVAEAQLDKQSSLMAPFIKSAGLPVKEPSSNSSSSSSDNDFGGCPIVEEIPPMTLQLCPTRMFKSQACVYFQVSKSCLVSGFMIVITQTNTIIILVSLVSLQRAGKMVKFFSILVSQTGQALVFRLLCQFS